MAKNIILKVARTKSELSQQQLADTVTITRQTISDIERRDYNPYKT
ncbi:Helix-turn-helix [Carnobacterium iners]|uniref:Helix-turn-helix n=1 Tax=Carnobacterium iners TaxID=1073423 RepID=A0A1X7MYE8_9LACT|nr:helix-turn-helix domain-containing protein [Carnobacterium iners]SMH29279.1 Helix-turn-helix [Carnobacterium iners]